MAEVFSIFVGKNGIIQSQKHKVDNNKAILNFVVTHAMLPSSNLIVYYIQSTGEVIFNQLKLEFGEILENFVSIFQFLTSLTVLNF